MNAVNNFPKPVIFGIVAVLLVVAAVVIFRTARDVATNNGYGTKEDIIARQKGGGAVQNGGRTAPTITGGQNGGSGRGGDPAGYGSRGPGR